MKINGIYTVIADLTGTWGRENLLVKNEKGERFLILTIGNPHSIRRIIPVLLGFQQNNDFCDYIESFSYDGKLCVVFAYRLTGRETPFIQSFSGAPLSAKQEALRSLIGAVLAQNIPYPVVCDVLRYENLFHSKDGEVKFAYNLSFDDKYNLNCKDRAHLMLAELVRELFEDTAFPAVDKFAAALEMRCFKNLEEVYAAFAEITKESTEPAEEAPQYKLNMRERLNAVLSSSIWASVPAAVILLAELALLCFIFYSVIISPPKPGNVITEIGTVKIHENTVEQ